MRCSSFELLGAGKSSSGFTRSGYGCKVPMRHVISQEVNGLGSKHTFFLIKREIAILCCFHERRQIFIMFLTRFTTHSYVIQTSKFTFNFVIGQSCVNYSLEAKNWVFTKWYTFKLVKLTISFKRRVFSFFRQQTYLVVSAMKVYFWKSFVFRNAIFPASHILERVSI